MIAVGIVSFFVGFVFGMVLEGKASAEAQVVIAKLQDEKGALEQVIADLKKLV